MRKYNGPPRYCEHCGEMLIVFWQVQNDRGHVWYEWEFIQHEPFDCIKHLKYLIDAERDLTR
jgi:hypothetical protein